MGLLNSQQLSALRDELTQHVYTDAKSVSSWIKATELSDLFSSIPDDGVVYYADGVHPTHNSRSTYTWIEKGKRLEQPTVSGRDRVNINGLLNAHDVTDVIARDCLSVNAQSTKELYVRIFLYFGEIFVIFVEKRLDSRRVSRCSSTRIKAFLYEKIIEFISS